MNIKSVCILFLASLLLSTQLFAQNSISVLLARTSGVSDSDAREMFDQIDDLASNSEIGSGGFVPAETSLGVPKVEVVVCGGSNGPSLVACARTKLAAKRDAVSADIVLLMVSQDIANDCGAIDPLMINRATVSNLNQNLGYAVIEKSCFLMKTQGQVVASHEVGHLLSIEHDDSDPNTSIPLLADANHARDNLLNNATAVASPGDCFPGCTWHNFFSDKDKDFSSALFDDAGNSSHSNAVNVVRSISWDVVSNYRTPSFTPECQINFTPVCNAPYTNLISVSLPGFPASNIDIDFSVGSSGSGTWNDIYEGGQTCPGFTSSLTNLIRAFYTSSQGISECEAVVIPIISPPGCDSPGGGIFD